MPQAITAGGNDPGEQLVVEGTQRAAAHLVPAPRETQDLALARQVAHRMPW